MLCKEIERTYQFKFSKFIQLKKSFKRNKNSFNEANLIIYSNYLFDYVYENKKTSEILYNKKINKFNNSLLKVFPNFSKQQLASLDIKIKIKILTEFSKSTNKA